jgi:pilus assembly protein CpaE
MNNVVRLSIVDPNDSSRDSLKSLLLGIDLVWLEAECSHYEFFTDVVEQTNSDIALVSLDADPEKALDLVAKISHDFPSCSVLVLSSSQEGSLILQAMRNGAKEFLNIPLRIEDFLSALDRIKQTKEGRDDSSQSRSSQVISVTGVSGGVGCTSLAINLACTLSQNDQNSVAIIDLDLALGDADVWLDIIPDYTIQDVAENITRLDYSLLKRSLTKHDCGVFLLPRPVEMADIPPITSDELKRVVALLKATFTHLIIDISKSFTPLDMAALEVSDNILFVTQLDLPCLRNVVRLTQFFDQKESVADKIRIVVNRIGLEDTQISLGKALETIGREIYWQLPNDYAVIVESRNNGVPLILQSPKSKLARAVIQLVDRLEGSNGEPEVNEEKKQKKGLFSFLGS